MKLQYLGTAAFEGVPALFCDCETCCKSRELGGRNVRSRSQAIIDDKILIDFPADTLYHTFLNNLELSKVHTCIITHSHCDHLYCDDILARKNGFSHPASDVPLVFYAHGRAFDNIDETLEKRGCSRSRVDVVPIRMYEAFESEGYTITAIKADHTSCDDPVIYIIQKDSRAVLYAHDTGYFPDETWEYIEKNGIKFDVVSLDCTEALTGISQNHMSLDSCREVKQRLINSSSADDSTVFVLNHFSHNGKITYDDLVPLAKKDGFEVSYDGMIIEF